MMEAIMWTLSLVSLWGCVYNVRKDPLCFKVWGVSNTGLIVCNAILGNWHMVLLFCGFTVLNVVGYQEWTKNKIKIDNVKQPKDADFLESL